MCMMCSSKQILRKYLGVTINYEADNTSLEVLKPANKKSKKNKNQKQINIQHFCHFPQLMTWLLAVNLGGVGPTVYTMVRLNTYIGVL